MKKLICFILLSAMLLTFTACSSDNEENVGDTTASDVSVSESIAETTDTPATETVSTEDPSEADTAKVNLLGEWIPSVTSVEENSNSSFFFNEDGSFSFGDLALQWETVFAKMSTAEVLIMGNGTPKYKAYLYKNTDGTSYISFCIVNDDGTTKNLGQFYKASEYTKLDITTENWENYFEIVEHSTIGKNSFGELDRIDVTKMMLLKKEYGSVCKEISAFAVCLLYVCC